MGHCKVDWVLFPDINACRVQRTNTGLFPLAATAQNTQYFREQSSLNKAIGVLFVWARQRKTVSKGSNLEPSADFPLSTRLLCLFHT